MRKLVPLALAVLAVGTMAALASGGTGRHALRGAKATPLARATHESSDLGDAGGES